MHFCQSLMFLTAVFELHERLHMIKAYGQTWKDIFFLSSPSGCLVSVCWSAALTQGQTSNRPKSTGTLNRVTKYSSWHRSLRVPSELIPYFPEVFMVSLLGLKSCFVLQLHRCGYARLRKKTKKKHESLISKNLRNQLCLGKMIS